MTLVITSCTNRKSHSAAARLRAANLPLGAAADVAANWAGRVHAAHPHGPARALYQGRAFREAELAAQAAGAELAILSAGLGLVGADADIPTYSLTVAPDAADNVLHRIRPSAEPAEWWRQLRNAGVGKRLVEMGGEGLVLVAAGRLYLEMLADEMAELPASVRQRMRVFTASPECDLPFVYSGLVMPYDERLDGPDGICPGTMSDFAQRALRDFVTFILPRCSQSVAGEHRIAVETRLLGWRRPERRRGAFRTDPEIKMVIAQNWRVVGGRSSAMLRLLRSDLGIACEQGRFRRLFNAVAGERVA